MSGPDQGSKMASSRSKIENLIGKKNLVTGDYNSLQVIDLAKITDAISRTPEPNTNYVIGHENPDADTIVTWVF